MPNVLHPFQKHKIRQGEKEIDYLVATDKLSEGQNLQDSGMIVNYDYIESCADDST